MDCSLSRSSVHGILQARELEWVAISFSKGSSQPRDQTYLHCRQILYQLSHSGSSDNSAGKEIINQPLSGEKTVKVLQELTKEIQDLYSSVRIFLCQMANTVGNNEFQLTI